MGTEKDIKDKRHQGRVVGKWSVHVDLNLVKDSHKYDKKHPQKGKNSSKFNINPDIPKKGLKDSALIQMRIQNQDGSGFDESEFILSYNNQNMIECRESFSDRFKDGCVLKSGDDATIRQI